MAEDSALDSLKRYYALQGERIQIYHLFEEGFTAYLNGAPNYNFPMYRQLVHEITTEFNSISQKIIDIKNTFSEKFEYRSISKCLENIQKEEKDKLEATAKLQIARQNIVDHPENEDYKTEKNELQHSLAKIQEKITEHMEDLKYESEELYEDVGDR